MKKLVEIKDIPYIDISYDIFTGNIEEVSARILFIRQHLLDAYEARAALLPVRPVSFTPFEEYQYLDIVARHNYDGSVDFILRVFRDETDAEVEDRELRERDYQALKKIRAAKRKATIEKRERAILEKLQKKYGDT